MTARVSRVNALLSSTVQSLNVATGRVTICNFGQALINEGKRYPETERLAYEFENHKRVK